MSKARLEHLVFDVPPPRPLHPENPCLFEPSLRSPRDPADASIGSLSPVPEYRYLAGQLGAPGRLRAQAERRMYRPSIIARDGTSDTIRWLAVPIASRPGCQFVTSCTFAAQPGEAKGTTFHLPQACDS